MGYNKFAYKFFPNYSSYPSVSKISDYDKLLPVCLRAVVYLSIVAESKNEVSCSVSNYQCELSGFVVARWRRMDDWLQYSDISDFLSRQGRGVSQLRDRRDTPGWALPPADTQWQIYSRDSWHHRWSLWRCDVTCVLNSGDSWRHRQADWQLCSLAEDLIRGGLEARP